MRVLLIETGTVGVSIMDTLNDLHLDFLLKTKMEDLETSLKFNFDLLIIDLNRPDLIRSINSDIPTIIVLPAGHSVTHPAYEVISRPISRIDITKAMKIAKRKLKRFLSEETIKHKIQETKNDIEYFESVVSEIYLVYQPIVRASTQSVFGYEALLRSRHPDFKGPGHLVDLSNKLGMSMDLGRIIRSQAPIPFIEKSKMEFLFINMFASELLDHELHADVSLMSRVRDRVVLEVTERESIDSSPEFKNALMNLRKLSYKIAVDDLGSGYSGLSSIMEIDPDIIKLEMVFSKEIHESEIKRNLVSSMVDFCNASGKEIIAEGVETIEEYKTLLDIGVDLYQGYLFARPGEAFPAVNWPKV